MASRDVHEFTGAQAARRNSSPECVRHRGRCWLGLLLWRGECRSSACDPHALGGAHIQQQIANNQQNGWTVKQLLDIGEELSNAISKNDTGEAVCCDTIVHRYDKDERYQAECTKQRWFDLTSSDGTKWPQKKESITLFSMAIREQI